MLFKCFDDKAKNAMYISDNDKKSIEFAFWSWYSSTIFSGLHNCSIEYNLVSVYNIEQWK